ncbi:YcjF family protein [Pseudorhodoferax sp. Leaf274]|uniref:YcjF family protein n=1 Tax=Pseudorhodoferax sp. Leaf274 TaxID=1736318 RepID=UPI0007039888|nr:TerB family tellurite resistance protein [Pseudorhodoferax sp. Leaf274]KQP36206.1 GTPase [Pseudorhodoferax sp. Leaf274]
MTVEETRAILSLTLMAAFVDGDKHERERAEIRRIADSLAQADGVHLPTLVQDVLMKRVQLDGIAAALPGADARQLAYEMAVCVCDADGVHSPAELRFLEQAKAALALAPAAADGFLQQADVVAAAPLATADAPPAPARSAVDEAALDKTILNAAILNGALELLPESLSTMAIIPLQMRLVFNIGKAHGYALDSGHIKDFLATVGVGLTSQYLEQAGRKLLGGLLGKLGGGLLGGVGRQAVSSGMSFATTYALGHVAKRYYAGGRVLSTQLLKDSYASLTQQAQGLHQQYLPQMREQARTLDTAKIMALVRGK